MFLLSKYFTLLWNLFVYFSDELLIEKWKLMTRMRRTKSQTKLCEPVSHLLICYSLFLVVFVRTPNFSLFSLIISTCFKRKSHYADELLCFALFFFLKALKKASLKSRNNIYSAASTINFSRKEKFYQMKFTLLLHFY